MIDFSMIFVARPSFTEGLSRIIDIGGTFNEYNYDGLTGEQKDSLALMADIAAINQDYIMVRKNNKGK